MVAKFNLHGQYNHADFTPWKGTWQLIISGIANGEVIKDTLGNTVLTGRNKGRLGRPAVGGDDPAIVDTSIPGGWVHTGELTITGLADPRDTTLNPTGFGYLLTVRPNDGHAKPVSFGSAALDAHLSGGVLEVEDVTPGAESTFSPVATYADASALAAEASSRTSGDSANATALAAEVTRATAAEATKVNSSTYTAGLAGKADASALTAETTRATAAEGANATAIGVNTTAIGNEATRATAAETALLNAQGSTIGTTTLVGGAPVITVTTPWGIHASGVPYYDPAGAAVGEEALLTYGPTGPVLTKIGA